MPSVQLSATEFMSTSVPLGTPLTCEQVRRIDRLAVERYGLSGLVLMENAGRNATEIVDRAYGPAGQAMIVCGTGNNGGDGCVIARHLHNCGWIVRVCVIGQESRMTADTLANWRIVRAMGLPASIVDDARSAGAELEPCSETFVLVDALLGTGFSGTVRSPLAEWIDAMNAAPKRATVAIDVPSGLNADTGVPSNATIRADLTITFVACKVGFTRPSAQPYVGRVEVADIGVPKELVAHVRANKE